MHTSCINAFVIWRSTQEELHRSSTLKTFYSWFTGKKHMYLQRQIAASHWINSLVSPDEKQPALYTGHLQWKNTACPSSLSWGDSPRGKSLKIPDAQTKTYVSKRLDQILHWITCPPHLTSATYGCKAAAQKAGSTIHTLRTFISGRTLAANNTNLPARRPLQDNASVRQPTLTRKRIPLLKLNHLRVFQTEIGTLKVSILQEETIAIAVQALGLRYNSAIFFWVH